MRLLGSGIRIVLHNAVDTKTFNYGFSNAIRMLNDLGVIKAEHRLDAQEIWSIGDKY